MGRASAPSGASTGDKEALELRDNDTSWQGKGVSTAINNIRNYIKPLHTSIVPIISKIKPRVVVNLLIVTLPVNFAPR